MDTAAKISYIRNSYEFMLSKSTLDSLYTYKRISQAYVEAWCRDATIDIKDCLQLDYEIECIYKYMFDIISERAYEYV